MSADPQSKPRSIRSRLEGGARLQLDKLSTEELNAVQGKSVDIGGYYRADSEKTKAVMRPSSIRFRP